MADLSKRAEPTLAVEGPSCPLPFSDHELVVMGHGGGGKLTGELIDGLFLPAFGQAAADATPTDSAVLDLDPALGDRLAFTTDSYVVQPLFFPGGNIGELAVNGTVNDLAMSGATPLALSTGFILEEGLELDVLYQIAVAMGRAASTAGVRLATGDTKVVERGHGDGVYINTAGVGLVAKGLHLGPDMVRPGDVIIVSGQLGLHGMAVLSVREGLQFGTEMESDTAPLNGLVAAMLNAETVKGGSRASPTLATRPGRAGTGSGVRVLRDLTRGGLAAALCELAGGGRFGIEINDRALPVPDAVRAGCGLLGLDPVHVANEGKLVAIVGPEAADAVLGAMVATEVGQHSTVIGRVVDEHPGVVVARTTLGASRVVDLPLGEQLPRIC